MVRVLVAVWLAGRGGARSRWQVAFQGPWGQEEEQGVLGEGMAGHLWTSVQKLAKWWAEPRCRKVHLLGPVVGLLAGSVAGRWVWRAGWSAPVACRGGKASSPLPALQIRN